NASSFVVASAGSSQITESTPASSGCRARASTPVGLCRLANRSVVRPRSWSSTNCTLRAQKPQVPSKRRIGGTTESYCHPGHPYYVIPSEARDLKFDRRTCRSLASLGMTESTLVARPDELLRRVRVRHARDLRVNETERLRLREDRRVGDARRS